MSATPVPAGHHTVAPYLAIQHGVKALEFYKKAFGATELYNYGQITRSQDRNS
jgi:PhnB protein